MGKSTTGAATWDDSQIAKSPNHPSLLAPRTDVRAEERCFVSLSSDTRQLRGFLQVFNDGSAAYWMNEGEQAKLAGSLDEAIKKVWTVELRAEIRVTSSVTATLTVK